MENYKILLQVELILNACNPIRVVAINACVKWKVGNPLYLGYDCDKKFHCQRYI